MGSSSSSCDKTTAKQNKNDQKAGSVQAFEYAFLAAIATVLIWIGYLFFISFI